MANSPAFAASVIGVASFQRLIQREMEPAPLPRF